MAGSDEFRNINIIKFSGWNIQIFLERNQIQPKYSLYAVETAYLEKNNINIIYIYQLSYFEKTETSSIFALKGRSQHQLVLHNY